MTVSLARTIMSVAVLLALVSTAISIGDQPQSPPSASAVVIPFDFESKFDNGRYGRLVGEMIWKKLERRGRFVIPESMLDARDWTEQSRTTLNPDTPLGKIQQIVRDEFGGDIAIWGKVERLPDVDWDEYDLWIKVANISQEPPELLVDIQARTKTVSEIPHVYVKQALDQLHGVSSHSQEATDTESLDARWRTAKNLLRGGDFESARGWDPLPPYVTRQSEADGMVSSSHFLRFTIPEDVAATTGVLYYSDYFPVEENATYRFQCRWRSTGSAVKVFVKCYDQLPTRFSQRAGTSRQLERREVYRSQQNLKGKTGQWNVHTEDFTPKHTQYQPRWGRVMLYGYWPSGVVDWDDVVLKQVAPPPTSLPAKVRRPSLETKVLSEELERTTRSDGRSDRD